MLILVKKITLKPKSVEINLLGFCRMEKPSLKKRNIFSIQSSTSLSVDNRNNCRSSCVSQCRKNCGKPRTHVLVFEGTTSPFFFILNYLKK